ncbi:MAG: T9SS type A sorting domain-containing protein [Candidatus Marinimicrobia bacterium]|nr:T9SS type A sorting domain-containing protein [Candidatus Neomarinimicrobiota bacterium]
MNKRAVFLFTIFTTIISAQEFQEWSGNIIQLDNNTAFLRTCPDLVDSCIYVCSEDDDNPCHPEEIYSIVVDSSIGDTNTAGSRFRFYFPWEYSGLTANKFVIRASWPCLSPTAVYASGNYAYFDIIGHEACPGTVQASIWYGEDCEDDDGNIGSHQCLERVGRFCLAPGDTLDWPEESDQNISGDICNSCWMSSAAWDNYADGLYSDDFYAPGYCESFDHCHHETPDSVSCGVGYLDGETVSIIRDAIPTMFELKPNFPNPFNPTTTIRFNIPVETQHATSLHIFDITGSVVDVLVNEKLQPGLHEIQWSGENRSSGVYILRAENGPISQTQKMVLMK